LPSPAAVVPALTTIASLVTAFANFTPAQSTAALSLATVIGTAVTCLAQRPVHMLSLTAVAGTVAGDLALFGVRMTSAQQAAVVAATGLVVGGLLHLTGVPAVEKTAAPAGPNPMYVPAPPGGPEPV
jgi:hypothetical protein